VVVPVDVAVGGVVAVQGRVPALRSHLAATTSTLMKSMLKGYFIVELFS
jgi:hypothetical protein